MLAVWIVISLALLLSVLSLRGDAARARYAVRTIESDMCLPASVIVPVKGMDENLAQNLSALASQNYPDFEFIVVAREAEDIPLGVLPPGARVVLAGPGDPGTGEKINNLLAAVAAVRPESRFYAFADSDSLVTPEWLRSLASVLFSSPRTGLATGYRWHLPTPPDFWSNLRSLWNSVVGGTFFSANVDFCWGGAMAIRRETFRSARVAEFWRGEVSDDFQMSRAIRQSGMQIAYAPGALTPDTSHIGGAELLAWIKRQMIITRVYSPKLWRLSLFAHLVYCGGMVFSAFYFPPGLAVQLILGMVKGRRRGKLAEAGLPQYQGWFRANGWIYTWWVPLSTWLWLYGLLISATTRTIDWRGHRIDLSRHNPNRPDPV